MKRALAVALAAAALPALACELPAASGRRVESESYALAYRALAPGIKLGEHFALEFALCAKRGGALPKTVAANAWMPEHRHGMNYRVRVRALGAGRYRAEGFLLHMPGHWELTFEAGGERLADRLQLD